MPPAKKMRSATIGITGKNSHVTTAAIPTIIFNTIPNNPTINSAVRMINPKIREMIFPKKTWNLTLIDVPLPLARFGEMAQIAFLLNLSWKKTELFFGVPQLSIVRSPTYSHVYTTTLENPLVSCKLLYQITLMIVSGTTTFTIMHSFCRIM